LVQLLFFGKRLQKLDFPGISAVIEVDGIINAFEFHWNINDRFVG